MQSYQDRIDHARAIAEAINATRDNVAKVWHTRNSDADHGTVRVYVTHSGHKFGFVNVPPGEALTADLATCTRAETFGPIVAKLAKGRPSKPDTQPDPGVQRGRLPAAEPKPEPKPEPKADG